MNLTVTSGDPLYKEDYTKSYKKSKTFYCFFMIIPVASRLF